MTSLIKTAACKKAVRPRVLVVDDEPAMIEMISDVVGRSGSVKLLAAGDLASARKIIAREKIDLLLADLHLPDGDGMALVPRLRSRNPAATAVIITGHPSVDCAIGAIRAGAADFLPKPFTADLLLERISKALARQQALARKETRMTRLRQALRKLNLSRRLISRKVDLLCNDLISAYGQLSRQVDQIRVQESFRRLLDQAQDLEQLLCHAMDWILRQAGYCNMAIWLASEEQEFELGAYMKYTIPGEPELTDAMQAGLLRLVNREGLVHLLGHELSERLTPAELSLLAGQEILGCNCTYLGETLAVIVMFRDEKTPFTDDDAAMLRSISPIFAVALAGMVRGWQSSSDDDPDGGTMLDDPDVGPRKNDADWWKRGEPPPF